MVVLVAGLLPAAGLVPAFFALLAGPFEAHGQSHSARRVLTIPVEVNSVPGTFLIDTGSDGTIIDSAFAEDLGLKPSGSTSIQRSYSADEGSVVTAEHVRIGPKDWSGVPLVTQDLSILSRMQMGSISGVLGTDLLATMTLKLSYSSGTAQVVSDIGDGSSAIALKRLRNRYFIPVRIGPSTLEMLLDSGTNLTALSNSAWQTLPQRPNSEDPVEGIQSSGSPPGSLLTCVTALQLGVVTLRETLLRDVPLRVIAPTQSGRFADPTFAGLLGGDILEHFVVTFDLQHASLYLKPDAEYRPDPYEFVAIGIQFYKADDRAFSVVAVWKHSPAEAAGVLVGDRILSVNGHSAADLGIEAFAKELHGAPGTPVVIEVERAAGRVILSMKTRQLGLRPLEDISF
jgi:predicted aspartyl protease